MLSVENLCFSTMTGHIIQKEQLILDHISFSVQANSAVAYIGENGAGKTSTFRILCGLAQPSEGEIRFHGQPVTRGLPSSKVGFMPEQPYFYKNLTPYEFLAGMGAISGIDKRTIKQRIHAWAEKLSFAHVLHQKTSTCSKGQIQRVGLAQALIHEPEFILLDEPLSGLDPIGRATIRGVIQDEIKRGATVLFSSHILSDAEMLCDHVIMLHRGKKIFAGAIESLLHGQQQWVIHAESVGHLDVPDSCFITQQHDQHYTIETHRVELRDAIIQQILSDEQASLIAVQPKQMTLEEAFLNINRGTA